MRDKLAVKGNVAVDAEIESLKIQIDKMKIENEDLEDRIDELANQNKVLKQQLLTWEEEYIDNQSIDEEVEEK